MARFKNFANSGTMIPEDLNTLRAEIDRSLGRWKKIFEGHGGTWTPPSGDQFLIPGNVAAFGTAASNVGFALGTPSSGGTWSFTTGQLDQIIQIQNEPLSEGRKTLLKYELLIQFALNPAGSFYGANATVALYPVVGQGHLQNQSGFAWITQVISRDSIAGTSLRIPNPVSNSKYRLVSNSFPMPQTGLYMLGMTVDSQPAPKSDLAIKASLLSRPSPQS